MPQIDSSGWSYGKIGDKDTYELLVQEKEKVLEEISRIDAKAKKPFSDTDNIGIEIKKSSIKSIIRYSLLSRLVTDDIARAFVQLHPGLSPLYYTLPYPITHLPDDRLEEGLFHTDRPKWVGELFTTWTPLNECDHHPLAIIPYSHKLPLLNLAVRSLGRISKKADRAFASIVTSLHPVEPIMGEFLTWNSQMLHRGNINKSKDIRIALVTRISDTPFYYEPTKRIDTSQTRKNNPIPFKASVSELFGILENVCGTLRAQSSIDASDDFRHFTSSDALQITDSNLKTMVSFALSVMAQRLASMDAKMGRLFDSASLYYGGENLVSLERLMRSKVYPKTLLEQFASTYISPSRQLDFILDSPSGNKPLYEWV